MCMNRQTSIQGVVSIITAGLLVAVTGCAGIGYVDETPCPDGSAKVRHKPRHGPSKFLCPVQKTSDVETVDKQEIR